MSVLVEAISVIIPLETLRAKYPGGPVAYARDCPNQSFCKDRHLTRVGFMTPDDTRRFVEKLLLLGFTHALGAEAIDLVVVDQSHGPTLPCRWLEAGRHSAGYAAAWKAGTVPGKLAHPPGWTPAQSAALQFASEEEAADRLLPLKRKDGLEVMLDFKTGREVHIGRAEFKKETN